ncbi:SpoIIE family protein phosphatase [Streptomyces natalensis]|uniref:Regulatory protein n=1 Tax=Streptomyces natalensis ATCC 27448 TaxID=1240678 RepID=A0A0D7CV84_9ACTN|nr:SpoIIE family protein phosphatase [Streptomyces natalensis]KIZ19282.1 regulatory protein [Streptomyces natalensis ATCC 27448]
MGTSTAPTEAVSRKGLPANQLAPAGARKFVRTVLMERARRRPPAPGSAALTDRFIGDVLLLVSELVTNAVMYAGTEIDVTCRLEPGRERSGGDNGPADDEDNGTGDGPVTMGVVVEVADRHPSRGVHGGVDARSGEPGYGLQLVSAVAESWGVTYRQSEKTVWFRLVAKEGEPEIPGPPLPAGALRIEPPAHGPAHPTSPAPAHAAEWADRGGPSFLAETSELLAGQLDQDMVTALAAQLLVPRLADWCAIWLYTEGSGVKLSRVWHVDERRIPPLRADLERENPSAGVRTAGTPWPWPESAGARDTGGSALAFPLVARDTDQGLLLLGRAGHLQMTDTVIRMVEDVARRVAQAVFTARQYTRQTTISRALQRRQLPAALASIEGVDTAIVYEAHGEGQTVGGDFYDIFPMGEHRWCFLLGDVQGKDPEAMSVTGLARHLVRLLAREGHGVESVLGRLNYAMAEDSAEAVELSGEQASSRFLSLLYGELDVESGVSGAHCTVATAGHPPPLHLFADGRVEPASEPQMLLGIDEGTEFQASSFDLAPGETLLCVTDGVTERRCGNWQLDDNDGLADILRDGMGLGAKALAEHVRRAAHDFGTGPVEDDLSVLVLQAVRGGSGGRG